MNDTQKQFSGLLLLLFVFISSLAIGQNSNNFEIGKNLDIFSTTYKELNINYVDEVKPGELMETAIDAMLKTLDPYTVYIPESEIEDVKFITTGQYGGIGALIQKQNDYVVISEPYEGKPAQKAGLKAGDILLEIDGKSAKGKSTSDVSAILKGQAGTSVNLKFERPGDENPIEMKLVRENVKIDNIPYYGMVSDNVGYIKLTGFTRNAGNEVKDAFVKLKGEHDLKGIILDLRGNGGGLLQEAVNISNIFVDKDEVIVSTKGKLASKNHTYRTAKSAIDNDIPLVVLVDGNSASASEIVAGAIQDLDRGVIIGERTFGKGLVQNVIPLTYNSQMKITVAKYYIPSGRCIQEIDYSHKDKSGHSEKVPDSLITAFKTKNGRTVYDGGGIEPDIKSERDEMSKLSMSLFTNFLFFDFATKFALENKEIAPPDEFVITDEIYQDFIHYISDKDYEYTTQCEETLEDLKEHAEEEGYFDSISGEYDTLFKKFEENKKGDIAKNEDEIKKILRFEIVSRYYYQKGKIISSLSDDKGIKKAIGVIDANDNYLAILHNGGSSNK
ncbi:MAG: S41 family peptidase [Chlorobi bacterium]|nr:S41 family peptidase [Chlorobiota bacterium]